LINNKKRYFVEIMGVVQGVGYRPYVYNKALSLDIKGWVSNQGSALVIDIEGERENIKGFLMEIIKNPPSLAKIEKVKITSKDYIGYKDFDIKNSTSGENEIKFIASDVATCKECFKEIFDSSNLDIICVWVPHTSIILIS